MDRYEASVQSVDAALRRLNATLASYKIQDSLTSSSKSKAEPTTNGPKLNGNDAAGVVTLPSQNAVVPPAKGEHPSGDRESDIVWRDLLTLRAKQPIREISHKELQKALAGVRSVLTRIAERPYCLPLYVISSQRFLALGYPDLAAGAAYKALLLSDAVQDAADEYHDDACEGLHEIIQYLPLVERIALLKTELHSEAGARLAKSGDAEGHQADIEVAVWLREHYLPLIYRDLIRSTFLCGSYRSAAGFMVRALSLYPNDADIQAVRKDLERALAHQSTRSDVPASEFSRLTNWPEKGFARREVYPWNDLEPDRFGDLSALNVQMSEVAPKLEVREVDLPAFLADGKKMVTQLGVFAKEDIAPGEIALDETSLLTANNKLQDALCDACSEDLPDLRGDAAQSTVACPDCEVVFCSERCYQEAMQLYHPALCGADVEAIAKDVPPAEAADSLYALLLLRALAMAETQDRHPLELKDLKYIWGDFHTFPLAEHWRSPSLTSPADASSGLPQTLPFSFEHNVRLPLHMLEKMDIDIFANPQYDIWVFNTLYAKFRGTASARLSGLGGRAIRGPEVSAVHPMWCLANHSCDPNVSWEWGGSIRFWARDERMAWKGKNSNQVKNVAGIKKGEEILNHYCDIDLPVKERREWARGALGGDCMCERCVWEAGQEMSS